MICHIAVEFKVPRHAHTVLQEIVKQNKEVILTVNDDGSIILSAQMLDIINGLDD